MVTWCPGMTLGDMERHVIEAAFRYHRSNKTATAAALGISVRTLDNKLEKYAEEEEAHKAAEAERAHQRAENLARARGTFGRPVLDTFGDLAAATAITAAKPAETAPVGATPAVAAAMADMPKPPPPAAKPKPSDSELDELLAPRKGR